MGAEEKSAFLTAEALDDWVVLHGGPTASYRTSNTVAAATLALEISQLPVLAGESLQLNIVGSVLTVRLTREVWKIETKHIEMARAISIAARKVGAVAQPSKVQEVQIAIAAKPEAIDLPFWRAVLGYDAMLDDNAVDPLGNSSTVWMQELESHKTLRHAMHLDVSVSRDSAEARFREAVAAGGVVVDDTHAPDYWILADRSGNKVCLVSWPDSPTDS